MRSASCARGDSRFSFRARLAFASVRLKYSKNYPWSADSTSRDNITKLPELKGTLIHLSRLCIAVNFHRIKFLAIATEDKIEVYAWAPKPYHKFMAFKVSRIYLGNLLRVVFTSSDTCTHVSSALRGKICYCKKRRKSLVSKVTCGVVLHLIGAYSVQSLF